MPKVEIYTKSWCPYCARAKKDLDSKGVQYEEIDVTTDLEREREMATRSGRHTVPQIFINGLHLGGSDDLIAAEPCACFFLEVAVTTEQQSTAVIGKRTLTNGLACQYVITAWFHKYEIAGTEAFASIARYNPALTTADKVKTG